MLSSNEKPITEKGLCIKALLSFFAQDDKMKVCAEKHDYRFPLIAFPW